jgi:hypothetical protein
MHDLGEQGAHTLILRRLHLSQADRTFLGRLMGREVPVVKFIAEAWEPISGPAPGMVEELVICRLILSQMICYGACSE